MKEKRIMAAALAMTAILAISMVLVPGNVSAGDGPKVVRGWVWDNAGNNLTGADVLVKIKDPGAGNATRTSLTDTTDADGFYSVSFGPFDWFAGDWIEIVVTYPGDQVINYTQAQNGRPIQFINATFPFEIPSLGSWAGFAIAGVFLGAVAVFLIVRRKKQ